METKRIIIGRDSASCDIKIDQAFDTVSNNHAVITLEGNTYIFTDNSSNGTLINGKKVHNKSVSVQPGDTIALAGTVIVTWEEITQLLPQPETPVSRPTVQQSMQVEPTPQPVPQPQQPVPPVQPQVQQPVQPQPQQPVPPVQSQVQQPQSQVQQPAPPVQPQVQQPQPQVQQPAQPVQPQVQQPVQPQVQQPQPQVQQPAPPVQPQVQQPAQPVQPQVQQPAQPVPPVIPVVPPVDPAPVQPQRPMQQGFEGKTMMDTSSYRPQNQSTTPPPAPSESTFRPQAPAAAVVTPAGGATPPPPAMNVPPTGQVPPGYQMPPQAAGAYKSPEVQAYLKKFNIGAFLMGPWWAIFHKVWIGLIAFVLPFIPAVGGLLQMAFVIYLGIKGSEMAWEKDERKDLAAFMKKQKTWMWVGIGFTIFAIIAVIIIFAVFGSALMSALPSMY